MALSPPDIDALLLHMQRRDAFDENGDPSEEDIAIASLQRATDLMEYATDLHDDPTEDDYKTRMLREGILAMAHSILITGGDDREAMYSPFSSERIGSYSYSMRTQQNISANLPTGVPEFDLAVALWRGESADGPNLFAHSGEKVFAEPFAKSENVQPQRETILKPDAWNDGSLGNVI